MLIIYEKKEIYFGTLHLGLDYISLSNSLFSSSDTRLSPPRWRNHERTCAKRRGGRHCRMLVFTLQIYTIIFSTKFEPFELDREQKMVWIMFCWLPCFVFIKANSMETYHSHAALVFMEQGLRAISGSLESVVSYNIVFQPSCWTTLTWPILLNPGMHWQCLCPVCTILKKTKKKNKKKTLHV